MRFPIRKEENTWRVSMDSLEFSRICSGRAVCRFEKVSLKQFLEAGGDEKSYEEVKIPKRATRGSAGYDFVTPVRVELLPGEAALVPTGVRCQLMEGYDLSLYPRSGLGFKYSIQLANTVGIVDSDYYYSDNEGHIMVKLVNRGKIGLILEPGDRFCQGIIREYFLSVDDSTEGSRNGGFGSTGV